LATIRALAATNPDHPEVQRALMITLGLIAPILQNTGDLGSARKMFEEYLQIARRLASANPTSATAQRDLSVGLANVGIILGTLGDQSAARPYFEQSLAVRQRLAAANPGNVQAQRDLLVSHVRLAELPGGERHRAEARRLAETLARNGMLSRDDPLFLRAAA